MKYLVCVILFIILCLYAVGTWETPIIVLPKVFKAFELLEGLK